MKYRSIDSIGFLLHDSTRLLRRKFEARGRKYGLSLAQWRLMVHLVREGSATQVRLAEMLEIEPISVSRLLDRMEACGWVERQTDKTDRRARIVTPTEKSVAAFSAVRATANEVYDEALAGISADQRAALISTLKTIIDNLSRTEDPSPITPNH